MLARGGRPTSARPSPPYCSTHGPDSPLPEPAPPCTCASGVCPGAAQRGFGQPALRVGRYRSVEHLVPTPADCATAERGKRPRRGFVTAVTGSPNRAALLWREWAKAPYLRQEEL